MIIKHWNIRIPDLKKQKELSQALNIHPVVAQLLINRKIQTIDEASCFLSADLSGLHDPFLLKDMDKAIARLRQSLEKDELVLIFGDYDVDGVTSSALLRKLLRIFGIRSINYIPHRMGEGYGLNKSIVEFARKEKVGLVVCVDCGINAFDEVEALNEASIDVVILDHHEPEGDRIPRAAAVVDPKRPDCPYPFKKLCAVGLVAKLMQAMIGKLPTEDLDLIAIGTIADVVELKGENRIFVKNGLPLIETTKKQGLMALLDVAKIKGKKMKPYFIGFILGPRLNAAGRMDSASVSLDLLLCENELEAYSLAQVLEDHNQKRQRLQSTVVQEALEIIEGEANLKDHPIIVVHKEGWHKGVLGIVASKLVERYYRPTIVISTEDGLGTGSARSIEGFHLVDALNKCAQALDNFGGHQRAAGLRLKHDKIDEFRSAINAFAKEVITMEVLAPTLDVDCEIDLSSLSLELVEIIDSLEPHGEGNPAPLFCTRNLTVKSQPSVMGKDTIKFWVTDGNRTVSAIGFGMADYRSIVQFGSKVDLAYSLIIDDWNKAPVVQLRLKDIRASN